MSRCRQKYSTISCLYRDALAPVIAHADSETSGQPTKAQRNRNAFPRKEDNAAMRRHGTLPEKGRCPIDGCQMSCRVPYAHGPFVLRLYLGNYNFDVSCGAHPL